MVKFGYTINYVSDVEEALVFFEKSFSMRRLFITEEKDYGELDTGQTTLAFASHELGRTNFEGEYVSPTELGKPLGVEIALVSDNVQSIHDSAIRNGAKELKAPETKPWGQTVSYVQSPGGILLELCTPIAK